MTSREYLRDLQWEGSTAPPSSWIVGFPVGQAEAFRELPGDESFPGLGRSKERLRGLRGKLRLPLLLPFKRGCLLRRETCRWGQHKRYACMNPDAAAISSVAAIPKAAILFLLLPL